MNREAWLIFIGFAVAGALALLGVTAWQRNAGLRKAEAAFVAARAEAEERAQLLTQARRELEAEKERADALARDVRNAEGAQKKLEEEMRAAVQSREVAVSALAGRLTVEILDRVLFDSGDATLMPEGTQVLDRVATVLARYPNRQILVVGHTDNVPIRVRFPSNWELSTARAVAAVRYLTEQAGFAPQHLAAVGYGEYRPIADNTTDEGRARNRRIAIVVLPEQIAPTDEVSTNAPPPPTSDAVSTNLSSNRVVDGAPLAAPGVTNPVPRPAHDPPRDE